MKQKIYNLEVLKMSNNTFNMPVAVHLLLIKENQILLLRRFNTGYEDGNYSVIAGHLDGGEDVISAMIREAKEEANIDILPNNIKIVGVMHRLSSEERIDFFLTAQLWSGEITNVEPHKCDQLAWFDLSKLPLNIIPYVKRGIDNYQSNIPFDIFGW